MLKRVTANLLDDNTCVKVYNPEKKELIAVYDTYKKTAAKLGLTDSSVQKHCTRKTRVYAPSINLEVALRISSIKKGDEERMEHCNKKTLLYL
jgi:hypothetical protein